jgi:hypothetical protein
MLSKTSFAGASALVAAPILVIVANLVRPTLSDDAAKQVGAFTDHRGAMIFGIAVSAIALVLLTAGIIWLAATLAPHAPKLAIAGGVLGVVGSLVVMFLTGVSAAAPAIVHALDPAQASATLHHVQSSAVVSGLEPLQLIGDIGLAVLGIAATKAGIPRWAAAAIAIGALGEGLGFATSTKALVILAFAVLFVGLVETVRTLIAVPGHRVATTEALSVS